jgi:hypothetical protein
MLIFVARSHHTVLWTSNTCVATLQTKFSEFTSMCDFVSGWVGGCCGLILGHPFDTLKVRQQALGKYLHAVNTKLRYKNFSLMTTQIASHVRVTFYYRYSQYRQNHNGVYQTGKQIISYSYDVQETKNEQSNCS